MRQRWILHPVTGRMVPASEYVRPSGLRSHLPAPRLMADGMEPVQSMLDGKMYDSKSQLRSTYRAAGVTEVGNDVVTERAPVKRPSRQGVKAAVGRAWSKAGLGS